MGIEPIFAAWKADHLPLMHTCFLSEQQDSNLRPSDPKSDALIHYAMLRKKEY